MKFIRALMFVTSIITIGCSSSGAEAKTFGSSDVFVFMSGALTLVEQENITVEPSYSTSYVAGYGLKRFGPSGGSFVATPMHTETGALTVGTKPADAFSAVRVFAGPIAENGWARALAEAYINTTLRITNNGLSPIRLVFDFSYSTVLHVTQFGRHAYAEAETRLALFSSNSGILFDQANSFAGGSAAGGNYVDEVTNHTLVSLEVGAGKTESLQMYAQTHALAQVPVPAPIFLLLSAIIASFMIGTIGRKATSLITFG